MAVDSPSSTSREPPSRHGTLDGRNYPEDESYNWHVTSTGFQQLFSGPDWDRHRSLRNRKKRLEAARDFEPGGGAAVSTGTRNAAVLEPNRREFRELPRHRRAAKQIAVGLLYVVAAASASVTGFYVVRGAHEAGTFSELYAFLPAEETGGAAPGLRKAVAGRAEEANPSGASRAVGLAFASLGVEPRIVQAKQVEFEFTGEAQGESDTSLPIDAREEPPQPAAAAVSEAVFGTGLAAPIVVSAALAPIPATEKHPEVQPVPPEISPLVAAAPEPASATEPGPHRVSAEPAAAAPNAGRDGPGGLSAGEAGALLSRGDAFFAAGDITNARLFYERAAAAGNGAAALRIGGTFDPVFLARARLRHVSGNFAMAQYWYRRASELGNRDAEILLRNLEAAEK